jgi:hypothetical protein
MNKVFMQNNGDFADVILNFSCLYYVYVPDDAEIVQSIYTFDYELRNCDSVAFLLSKTSRPALRATQPPSERHFPQRPCTAQVKN